MDELFDDISRILASPVPRRRALKLVVGGLAGAALAVLGFERPAYGACTSGKFACGTKCCDCANEQCCNGTSCCAKGVDCCGTNCDKCCASDEFCRASDKKCIKGSRPSPSEPACPPPTTSPPEPCTP